MPSSTTEIPIVGAATKSKHGADNLESEAIGLDVPVRIHGSQVAAVVLDTTEHVEPFEEDTSTMIVFPRGAVVKLKACVRTGHALVLTNLNTKQTALCRIIQVNSAASMTHYVKLEFSQPAPGFWGVHFPSDGHAAEPLTVEAAAPSGVPETTATSTLTTRLEKKASSGPTVSTPSTGTQPEATAPARKPFDPATVPAPNHAPNYGASSDANREVVPLAAATTKGAAITPAPSPAFGPSQAPREDAPLASISESPIFDSLSTDEEIFGERQSASASPELEILKSDKRVAHAFVRSLEHSALLQGEAPKRGSGVLIFASITALLLLAGGGWYLLQHRSVSPAPATGSPSSNVAAPPAIQSSPAPSTVTAPVQDSKLVSSPTPAAPTSTASTEAAGAKQPPPESTITVTPAHAKATPTASTDSSAPPPQPANIFAGDLTARPKLNHPGKLAVAAPPPKIPAGAPKDMIGASAGGGIGSLIGGQPAGVPAPVAPQPDVATGGKLVPPQLIRSVPPSYPALANSTHVQGDVKIEALIDETGKVASAKVISGPGLLRNAALTAVRQWKYSPAMLDGKKIGMQYIVTIRFRLSQ